MTLLLQLLWETLRDLLCGAECHYCAQETHSPVADGWELWTVRRGLPDWVCADCCASARSGGLVPVAR